MALVNQGGFLRWLAGGNDPGALVVLNPDGSVVGTGAGGGSTDITDRAGRLLGIVASIAAAVDISDRAARQLGIALPQPFVRQTESVAALGAAATFTGGWRAITAAHNRAAVQAFADQAGTLFIDWSNDGATPLFVQTSTSGSGAGTVSLAAGQSVLVSQVPIGTFYRLRYINGAVPQGSFFASSMTFLS